MSYVTIIYAYMRNEDKTSQHMLTTSGIFELQEIDNASNLKHLFVKYRMYLYDSLPFLQCDKDTTLLLTQLGVT